ncbi:hypothetical protein PREVCOP_04140 [Segatella copri DSM 18205]|uniref:Uncharacterized protein n=1 Tax=Segatella copri DSM 18205 TaxID=537011 RepID=D1PAB5_9BACT|nr:hypothetical protein PREVCOP_04140 [Segatella copri DSM 18205]
MKTRITEKNNTGRNIEEEVIRTFNRLCAYIYIMYFPEGTHQKQRFKLNITNKKNKIKSKCL